MPEKETIRKARQDKREGKSPSTQAGEFVREEIHHIREGKHGARSTTQAIAIGLSKARRAGVKLRPPKKGTTSEETRRAAARDSRRARSGGRKKTSARRSRAMLKRLKREGGSAASPQALARQAAVVGAPPERGEQVGVGEEGRAHQGSGQAAGGGEEGGQDQGSAGINVERQAQEDRVSNVSQRLPVAGGRNRRRRASLRNADCCGRLRESSFPQSSRAALRLQMPPAAGATPH